MFLAVMMIRLFQEYHIPMKHLFLVHCNHKTRPETDQEEQFIRDYFKDQQLFVVQRPSASKHTEQSLRNRRYQEWKTLMEKHSIDQLYLGHHFDDRVETTLLNLLRGCGMQWFLGIKNQENHHLLWGKTVIRPLLTYRKKDILKWCKKLSIPYVTDQSNFDIHTSQRNKIRIEVLPWLFAQKGFEKVMKNIYQKEEKNQISILLKSIISSPDWNAHFAYEICLTQQEITSSHIAQLLKQLHASAAVTSWTIKELWKFLAQSTNGWKYLQGITFFVAHGKLYAIKAPQRFREKTIDKQQQIPTSWEVIRYPQPGDTYKGKTRNKYCINKKIPLFRRNFIPITSKEEKIVKIHLPY